MDDSNRPFRHARERGHPAAFKVAGFPLEPALDLIGGGNDGIIPASVNSILKAQ
jgi:hypothetical protein